MQRTACQFVLLKERLVLSKLRLHPFCGPQHSHMLYGLQTPSLEFGIGGVNPESQLIKVYLASIY